MDAMARADPAVIGSQAVRGVSVGEMTLIDDAALAEMDVGQSTRLQSAMGTMVTKGGEK
jgi:hypothetical protein